MSTPVLLNDGVVRTERLGAVLLITLNRPDARNAVNREVALALGEAVELLADDDTLRVGVLTGTGAAFCAGMDLKAFAAGERPLLDEHPDWGFAGFVSHYCPKPLIAAVNGFAFGGGFELVLTCDLVIAAEEARFALPEVTRGLIAGAGGLPRLAQQVPAKVAAHLAYTGIPLSAAEAERWGLVNAVVPADELRDAALALAATIAANAPLALASSKRLLTGLEHESAWDASTWTTIQAEFEGIMSTADALEGATAFAEKRAPEWSAR